MRSTLPFLFAGILVATGCTPSEPDATETEASAEATEGATEEAVQEEAAQEAPEAAAEPAADTFIDGIYSSQRYNVRFRLPDDWRPLPAGETAPGPLGVGSSEDSLTLVGPAGTGLHMVIANSESIQLVGTSFDNLDSRVGFDNVNIIPDRSRGGSFNGVPGYRTEGDALLRGEAVPIAFIAQALDLPEHPTMITIFLPLDMYSMCYGELPDAEAEEVVDENGEVAPAATPCDGGYYSDVLTSVLDSVEVIDLQRQ